MPQLTPGRSGPNGLSPKDAQTSAIVQGRASYQVKWNTGRGAISVTGTKFMNWSRGVGSGGAIDLAVHLWDLDFRDALGWLSRHFPASVPGASSYVLRTTPARLLPGRQRIAAQDRGSTCRGETGKRMRSD